MLHELEHAYQSKKVDNSKDNSIETKLNRACKKIDKIVKSPESIVKIINSGISPEHIDIYIQNIDHTFQIHLMVQFAIIMR